MLTYRQLTDDDRFLAHERFITELLESIQNGNVSFGDRENGSDIQERINKHAAKATKLKTPWFLSDMIQDDAELKEMLMQIAVAEAQEALYLEPGEIERVQVRL